MDIFPVLVYLALDSVISFSVGSLDGRLDTRVLAPSPTLLSVKASRLGGVEWGGAEWGGAF